MWIDGRPIDDIGASCLFMSGRGKERKEKENGQETMGVGDLEGDGKRRGKAQKGRNGKKERDGRRKKR